jgi:sec-independent protein translocase protein TatA
MFGYPGFWQILIVVLLVVLLFGRGKISDLMGDVAKGITSFKKGLKDDKDEAEQETVQTLEPGVTGEQATPLHKEKADLS